MRIHVEHQGRGEEQAKGRILGRILAVVTPAVLFCLFATWGAAAQVDTTTTVSFPGGSFVVGQSVTVTWTVNATQTPSFTFVGGTLERSLWDPDGMSLNPGDVTPVSGPLTDTYAFNADKAGTYTAGGNYTGCPTCTPVVNGSSATDETLTVNKRSTSTAVTGPTTAVVGEPLTFTVDVTDSSGAGGDPPTTAPSLAGSVVWTVTLPDTSTATLNGTVDGSGDGTISYSPPVTGDYTIAATYQGNASYNGSADTMTPTPSFSVAKRDTALAVAGAVTAVVAEPVEVTATVSDNSGKTGSPAFSGTVTWSTSNGSGSFNSTSCTVSPADECSVTYTPASGDIGLSPPVEITATYDGDPNYGSSSGTHDVTTVSKRTTTAAVTVPSGTLYVNEPLTFSVQVSDDQVGKGTSPSLAGNIDWTVTYTPDGGMEQTDTGTGTTVDSNGYGTFNYIPPYATDELAVGGGYEITSEYIGNTDYAASAPVSDTFTVAKRTTSAAITVPTAPLYVNEPLTFSVQVSDDQVGTGTSPSLNGTADLVTWMLTKDGSTEDSGTTTVDASGAGTIAAVIPTAVSDPVGSLDYEISLEYAGNTYYGESNDAETFTVEERPTLMSVTTASAYVSETITITATVSDVSGVAGSPDFSGTVTWADTGSADLSSTSTPVSTGGVCSVTYTPVAADAGTTVTVTARYDTDGVDTNGNDDPNYGISEDSDNVPVSKRPTKTQNLTKVSGTYLDETWDFQVDVVDMSGVGDTPPSFDTGATVTWTVTRPDSSTSSMTEVATADGTGCTITYDPPMAGTYGISANYEGNANYAASDPDASLTFTASKWPTSTTIGVKETPPLYVQKALTFEVQVSEGSPAPVSSYDLDGNVVVTVTFDAGSGLETATLTGTVDADGDGTLDYTPPYATADLTTGYQVTVQYLGNSYYAESPSTPQGFDVDKWPTTVTVAPAPALHGGWLYKYEPWQFTVTVVKDVTAPALPFTPDFSGNVKWTAPGAVEYSFSPSAEGTVDASGHGDVTFTA